MRKSLSLLYDLLFRPDKLIAPTYDEDPRYLSAQELVLEACNILDESEEAVLGFVAEQAHCNFNYDEWMRTNTLPPMMLQWLRNNIHHLRERIT